MFGVPRVVVHDSVGSTLDEAHALAQQGAVAGTVIVADEQTASRGRGGKVWRSPRGAGLWLTVIERPDDSAALEVLSLRLGMATAAALDEDAGTPVGLKWPNDLYLPGGKLAGILVETRWREQRIEWVAIGIGVNVRVPAGVQGAAGLRAGAERIAVLARIVPAAREASARRGPLTAAELAAFAARDIARGRVCNAPERGIVAGITSSGGLRIMAGETEVVAHSGSLILQEEA